jgi:glutamine---fructose-6-phosphate transaminase (isomerizing)
MCGVFGFIATRNNGPDLSILRTIATVTETRGRHAFGLAWVDADGTQHTFKSPGAISRSLGVLDDLRHARVVIGHCRYATHGSPDDNINNHPHRAGRGVIVHNGVVGNYAALARSFDADLVSECDSEILGHIIARTPGSLGQRGTRMAERAVGDLTVLGVWTNPARLLIVRHGNPLRFGATKGGFYFGSLPEGLPEPEPFADNTAMVLTHVGGKTEVTERCDIAPQTWGRKAVTWDRVNTYATR